MYESACKDVPLERLYKDFSIIQNYFHAPDSATPLYPFSLKGKRSPNPIQAIALNNPLKKAKARYPTFDKPPLNASDAAVDRNIQQFLPAITSR